MKDQHMRQRHAARLGRDVSEIGFGAWAIGGSWGEVAETEAEVALNAALDYAQSTVQSELQRASAGLQMPPTNAG